MKKSKLAKMLGVGALLLSSALHAEFGKEDKLESIESMRDVFNILYAPKEWKKVYNNVYLDAIFDYDRLRVLLDPNLTLPLFQQEIQRSAQDIEDYHVGMHFTSTELAYLPFSVVVVNDQFFPRYFVSHVYVEDYPLSVGDELLSFDGKPIYWVINKLRREGGYQNRRQTDHRILAESILTVRQRSRGFEVPKGELMVEGIRQADGKIVSYELNW
ncbi:MAG: PDZ domain-containing protein [Exilibacterium sp.]